MVRPWGATAMRSPPHSRDRPGPGASAELSPRYPRSSAGLGAVLRCGQPSRCRCGLTFGRTKKRGTGRRDDHLLFRGPWERHASQQTLAERFRIACADGGVLPAASGWNCREPRDVCHTSQPKACALRLLSRPREVRGWHRLFEVFKSPLAPRPSPTKIE